MWQYVVLIFLPIAVQHINVRQGRFYLLAPERQSKLSMKLFWLWLLMMLLLRHETIGTDLLTYKRIFNMTSQMDWLPAITRSSEFGWGFMNKLISVFTTDFRWVLIISAILTTFFVIKAYLKYTNDATLSIVLFVNMSNFILLFSGLRQGIAISLGFLAFEYVRKKKLFPFLLVVLLAFLFHTSAFMLLFMYPLYRMRIKRTWLIWIIPLLVVFYIFNQPIFTFLGFILNTFADYDATISPTGAYTMLILFIIFAVFSFVIPNEDSMDDDTIGMRNFLLLAIVLQMFAPLHNLAMRMNYYYIAFIPLVIPRVIQCRSERWAQISSIARHVMVVFFIAYFFIVAPSENILATFPYRFVWEKF